MKRATRRLLSIATAIGLMLLLWGVHRSLFTHASTWLDVGTPPQKADAVVLLNGGANTRPFVAAALVRGRWAPRLLFSTLEYDRVVSRPGDFPTSREINLRILDHCRVPRRDIEVLDGWASTTFDEAKAVAAYLNTHVEVRRLLVVTDWPHTRRADWIFRHVFAARPSVDIRMVSAPMDEFQSDNWWRSELGFIFVLSEYLKLFFYAVWYGWLGYELLLATGVAIFLRWRLRRRTATKLHTTNEGNAVPHG